MIRALTTNNPGFPWPVYYPAYTSALKEASLLTDVPTLNALANLELRLLNDGLLSAFGTSGKLRAVYPLVGGTEAIARFNLADPRNLDAAFRLTFPVGATFSAAGVDFNGTSQYARTFFNPALHYATSSGVAMGVYSREDTIAGSDACDMGTSVSGTSAFLLSARNVTNGAGKPIGRAFGTVFSGGSVNGQGFFQLLRTSANTTNGAGLYRNGVLLASGTGAGTLPNGEVYIGTITVTGTAYNPGMSNRQLGFAYIGENMTATDIANMETNVQQFMIDMNRAV